MGENHARLGAPAALLRLVRAAVPHFGCGPPQRRPAAGHIGQVALCRKEHKTKVPPVRVAGWLVCTRLRGACSPSGAWATARHPQPPLPHQQQRQGRPPRPPAGLPAAGRPRRRHLGPCAGLTVAGQGARGRHVMTLRNRRVQTKPQLGRRSERCEGRGRDRVSQVSAENLQGYPCWSELLSMLALI